MALASLLALSAASAGPQAQTLEDIYGDTGNTFQGAIGFLNFESTDTMMNPAQAGYGLAIDDMVVEWREFTLVPDQTNCATGGQCAALQLDTTNVFEGQTLLNITVVDATPYGDPAAGPIVDCDATPANQVCRNDCDDDGDITGPTDDNDCDNNGTRDVVVRVTSVSEATGELVYLNRTDAMRDEYVGEIPVSSAFNAGGVLFIEQLGTDSPAVTVTYDDNEDGTGVECNNDVQPEARGEVQVSTAVLLETGRVVVVHGVLTDDGDHDGFADTNETVDMRIRIRNTMATAVTNLIARIRTNDPKIDCILDSAVAIPLIDSHSEVLSIEAFRFKVANVNRTGVSQDFAATFKVTLLADTFGGAEAPQNLTIDLDLNASGGTGPGTFTESFESGLGSFVTENLDASLDSLAAANGWRCQYSDPDWNGSSSYGTAEGEDCFPGATAGQAAQVFWQQDGPTSPGGGRAYTGASSLYYGINQGGATPNFTTPTSVIESVRSNNPINLSGSANSVLTFRQQVSLVDDRSLNTQPGRSTGRGVIMARRADSGGAPLGDWIKLEPYLNSYDQQAEDTYFNCFFDPTDDGHNEDDFFDPTDPDRRLGPSSTCFPVFSYSHQGSTVGTFAQSWIGSATEGPGLPGSIGPGTWIESKVDLSRFRGQRLRLRFLATDIQVTGFENWVTAFSGFAGDPGDDGWWIDGIEVTSTLTSPATLSVDNSGFAGTACGAVCNSVNPVLAVTPPISPVAGQAVELDASGSTADRCLDGTLQYRFCKSNDDDCIDSNDTLLRSWTDNAVALDAPLSATHYALEVRCTSLHSCAGAAGVTVPVSVPAAEAPQTSSNFWVVNEGSQSLTVIDMVTEQVVGGLPLPGAGNPYDITFSTVDGHAGDFAFVTQGPTLRIVDTSARMLVNTIDVRTLPGFPPVVSLRLKGADSARLQRFTVSGTPRVKAFLHLNADAEVSPGVFQPWFVVIDQEALLGLSPGAPILVQSGMLFPSGEALRVTVQSAQEGNEFQRVWHTLRSPTQIRAVRLASPRETVPSNWAPRQVFTQTVSLPPDGLLIGVPPPSRPPAILPQGSLGTLRDLYSDQVICDFGGNLRAAAVTGPGALSYRLFALDGNGFFFDARMDAPGCGSPAPLPVGLTPVDIDTAGEVFFQRVLVTNRDSNDVTVFRGDGTTGTTIPLPTLLQGGPDPNAGEAQEISATSCNHENLRMSATEMSWAPVGCETTLHTVIWCQCNGSGTCPVECDGDPCNDATHFDFEPECLSGIEKIGDTPWEPLGIRSPGSTTYTVGLPGAGVNFLVTFDDTRPGL